ncbi:gamma-glutamyltransferase family protein [Marimonas arenosa]|uniref:Gamma-glutamyltransferase family protein n=1 Tax=Marimonas arenosa TaxID=1795305 RepID=A0AAE4B343_9RHOB|nr:gamma-glutamyltransferase family protein [Marimonas arenosa]MDQ2088912.1 gamma-glutamyltransferase family protein [Marimonas arenosa]
MIETALGLRGGFTAPHRVATKVGADVLDAGGSAIEAMVAAAATIAVVYPHMNGIGGDGFWLIHRKDQAPVAISACGPAAGLATPDWYAKQGYATSIPARGALAALTVPGTVSGWQAALELVDATRRMPLADLLGPAIALAKDGVAVTRNQSVTTAEKIDGLRDVPGFADIYLARGAAPVPGTILKQDALGDTLATIAANGPESFYRGDVARAHARFLEQQGSPLRLADFDSYVAELQLPLTVTTSHGQLFNMGPPTQGMSALAILGVFDRLGVTEGEGFDHLHGLVEATKQAFIIRNAELGDPNAMRAPAQDFLTDTEFDRMAAAIDRKTALPWPHVAKQGDTIWMGAADRDGTVVSFIQSVFWEFGSGLTCPETGVVFQNRGAGFSLSEGPNRLAPGRRPFHTLNPALAVLDDGRVMAYGTMGGEGQPQTQAAVFTRHVQFGMPLQQAVSAPRWLLGKTWGDNTTSLKLEESFDPALVEGLRAAGHEVELTPAFSSLMGHAGAIVRHPDGRLEAASDPRSDGLGYAV